MVPDEYTFNAVLTAAVSAGAPLHDIDGVVCEMTRRGVRVNTHLGTTLVNAYKRCPEMATAARGGRADGATATLLLEKAHDVLGSLAAARQANAHTYGTVMAMHAQLGDAPGVLRLLSRMEATGVPPDGMTLSTVAKSCAEAGLTELSERLAAGARALGGGGGGHSGGHAARKKAAIKRRRADQAAVAVLGMQ